MFSNLFNIFYLIISTVLFPYLKKYYSRIVKICVIGIAFGSIGRYLCGNDYKLALGMSMIVAICHMPIVNAPFNLVEIFDPS